MNETKLYKVISIILGTLFLFALYYFVQPFFKGYTLSASYYSNSIPIILGMAGLLVFVTSEYKKSNLLRMYMCYVLFSLPFTVLYYIKIFVGGPGRSVYENSPGWQFFLGIFITMLYGVVCATGLWFLSKRKIPKVTYTGQGEGRVGHFEPASAGLRFLNRLIDVVFILLILVRGILDGRLISKELVPDGLNNRAGFFILELFFTLLYYLLLEGIFNTTAGKCATNTCIVNENGQRPNFGQVLGRTFCRLIPFEALSFFKSDARGWHDSIPNTWVVESIDKEEEELHEIILDAEKNMQRS